MRRLLPLIVLMVIPLAAEGAATDCNAVITMSQGREVYNAQSSGGEPAVSPLEASTGEQWMLMFKSGKVLAWWTNPDNWIGLGTRHRCGTDAEIDSVVFIFDPFGSPNMTSELQTVLTIIADRYPSAVPYLTVMVGGEGHVICYVANSRGQLVRVRASQSHAAHIGEMTMPEAGPDLDVPCSEFISPSGKLSNAGAAQANAELGTWFVSVNN